VPVAGRKQPGEQEAGCWWLNSRKRRGRTDRELWDLEASELTKIGTDGGSWGVDNGTVGGFGGLDNGTDGGFRGLDNGTVGGSGGLDNGTDGQLGATSD
jgi:hypothetical protein